MTDRIFWRRIDMPGSESAQLRELAVNAFGFIADYPDFWKAEPEPD